MSVQGPFRVDCRAVFPHGVVAVGGVSEVNDFDRSTREHRVQQLDRATGLPMWQVDVLDLDPEARERTFKVKLVSADEPSLPPMAEGMPVRPVFLDGLTVTPYLKEIGNGRSRIAYSLRADALSAPRAAQTKAQS